MRAHRSRLHPASVRPALLAFAFALALALAPGSGGAPASQPPSPNPQPETQTPEPDGEAPTVTLTLPTVFHQLRSRHPALAAARAAAEAGHARIDAEGAWMDPRLRIELMRDDTTRLTTYDDLEFGLTQEIPLSGRPRLRARAAAAEASVADAQATRREWLLLNQARATFTRIAADDERLVLNRQLHDLAAQARSLLRLAYETSLRPQADLLALDTELARLAAERTDLLSARAQDAAQLNALLLNPPRTAIAPASLPPPSPPPLPLTDAVSRAREYSPDIVIALRETTAAGARLAIARKNQAVDPEFMVAARHMNGSGKTIYAYDTGIAFSLPWFNGRRNRSEIRAAEHQLAAARAEADATEAEVAGMAASAHARVQATHEQVLRYQNQLVPLADASAAAVRRDYETGRADLSAVLDAQRMVLDTRMKLADTRAEHALAAAELAFLTGADLQTANEEYRMKHAE